MKLTKSKLKQIIKEELSNVLAEGGTMGHSSGPDLKQIVEDEFQAWQEEQKANLNRFQPGLGAGGSAGKAGTQRSQVYYKVEKRLIQDYGFIDGVTAYKLKMAGEQYDKEKVVDISNRALYKEIYDILYDLIPRPRLHGL